MVETEKKTIVYLTRHGETEWNLQKRYQGSGDSPLTELGISQAKLLANHLNSKPIDIIFTSPAGRAKHTAEIIRGDRAIELLTNNAFAEINLGPWEGKYYYDMELEHTAMYQAFWKSPNLYKPEYGESFEQVANRTFEALKDLIKNHTGKNILVVSHAVAIKSLLNTIEGRSLDQFWEKKLLQTSLSIVEAQNGSFKILAYGNTDHLSKIEK
jgi:phosphoserine phosphatase